MTLTVWAIWHARNKLVHNRLRKYVQDMVGFILGYLAKIEGLESVHSKNIVLIKPYWKPSVQGFIKLNFGYAFNLQGRASWSGVIARNEEGLIMGACTYPHHNIGEAFVAEARACELAVKFAQDVGFRRIQVEGDSLTIIKKVHAKEQDRSVLSPILSNIVSRLGYFQQISFHHVQREANQTAHTLAQEGRCFVEEHCWIEEALEVAIYFSRLFQGFSASKIMDLLLRWPF